MSPSKKTVSDSLLAEWLKEFRSKGTQAVYLAAINNFKKAVGVGDLKEYVSNHPDTVEDVRKFLVSMEGKPSKTISTYAGAVKVFFQDQGIKVPDESWKKIRRRGFMPKRVRAETRDRKPTKIMLRKILNYADIKLRALILFLVSSGARIGETLRMKKEDFDLEADPPRAHIRREYTKGGLGERTVFFSYEARDTIKDWLRIKADMGKRDGTKYASERVFSFTHNTAKDMWNLACDKAGLGDKSPRTRRRIYHLHSLRKFFRTKIGLNLDVTHALMGHAEYLDSAYVRLDQDTENAEAYKEAIPNVSIYQIENEDIKDIKEETQEWMEDTQDLMKNLKDENKMLKFKLEQTEQRMSRIENVLLDLRETMKRFIE